MFANPMYVTASEQLICEGGMPAHAVMRMMTMSGTCVAKSEDYVFGEGVWLTA